MGDSLSLAFVDKRHNGERGHKGTINSDVIENLVREAQRLLSFAVIDVAYDVQTHAFCRSQLLLQTMHCCNASKPVSSQSESKVLCTPNAVGAKVNPK